MLTQQMYCSIVNASTTNKAYNMIFDVTNIKAKNKKQSVKEIQEKAKQASKEK